LCEIVKKYHPIYMNLHFNHPDELTPEVKAACGMLADAGVPLGGQTVLLKGVNDDPEIMKRLVHQLLLARVKPYYLYQADLTKGTNHFRTTVETGMAIISALQGHTSGMAVPHFVIDAPGGGGKIPILPADYLVHLDEDSVVLKNYENKTFHYPQPPLTPSLSRAPIAPQDAMGHGRGKREGRRRELPMVGACPEPGGSTGSPPDSAELVAGRALSRGRGAHSALAACRNGGHGGRDDL
ncbi:MAG: KamA family radical SAM protein, partial [Nitrospiraceae bacterium]